MTIAATTTETTSAARSMFGSPGGQSNVASPVSAFPVPSSMRGRLVYVVSRYVRHDVDGAADAFLVHHGADRPGEITSGLLLGQHRQDPFQDGIGGRRVPDDPHVVLEAEALLAAALVG